jgi:hypothetical protein
VFARIWADCLINLQAKYNYNNNNNKEQPTRHDTKRVLFFRLDQFLIESSSVVCKMKEYFIDETDYRKIITNK